MDPKRELSSTQPSCCPASLALCVLSEPSPIPAGQRLGKWGPKGLWDPGARGGYVSCLEVGRCRVGDSLNGVQPRAQAAGPPPTTPR